MNIIQKLSRSTVFIILFIALSCAKKEVPGKDEKVKSSLTADFMFPDNIYTHKKYRGRITFYNSAFDTIVRPRIDTANFRFIIYKPFESQISKEDFVPIFKDSILLEDNSIDIEFEFDKPGIYNVGGFARDALMVGYYSSNRRDSVRIIEHELLMIKRVHVRDSI